MNTYSKGEMQEVKTQDSNSLIAEVDKMQIISFHHYAD